MASKIDIISNALLLIGDRPLNSLDEQRAGATVAANIYDTSLDAMLTAYTWRFASGKAQLAQLVADPLNEWTHAYQLPSDLLQIHRVIPHADYEIYEDNLYTHLSEVDIDYTFRPAESEFPAYFVEALQYKLASQFAVSVTENRVLKQDLLEDFRLALIHAQHVDSVQRPNTVITESPFTDIR